MKKILLVSAVLASTFFSYAQKSLEPGAAAVNKFHEEFGNVSDLQWTRQDYFDVAVFTQNGQQTKAYFDTDGELVGTVTPKTLNDLPQTARKDIAKKYAGYQVGDVILYDDNEEQIGNIILFGTDMESKDNYFADLKKDNKRIVLKITPEGSVSFFKELKW